MAEEIDVDMDGVWRTATDPDWLTTFGVDSCIAVAIGDDASEKGWLIHSPSFGQSDADLREMLEDAVANRPDGAGLRIWVCGAVPDCESGPEVIRAKAAVKGLISQLAPQARTRYEWPAGGDAELTYESGSWRFALSGNDLELDP